MTSGLYHKPFQMTANVHVNALAISAESLLAIWSINSQRLTAPFESFGIIILPKLSNSAVRR